MEDVHFEGHCGGEYTRMPDKVMILDFWISLALQVFLKSVLEMGHIKMRRKVGLISI